MYDTNSCEIYLCFTYVFHIVIAEANWKTLVEDMDSVQNRPACGYDAIICLGNSFTHVLSLDGDQENQKQVLRNYRAMLKPGGVLIIDHRNFDEVIKTGVFPSSNIYYNVSMSIITI